MCGCTTAAALFYCFYTNKALQLTSNLLPRKNDERDWFEGLSKACYWGQRTSTATVLLQGRDYRGTTWPYTNSDVISRSSKMVSPVDTISTGTCVQPTTIDCRLFALADNIWLFVGKRPVARRHTTKIDSALQRAVLGTSLILASALT